MQLRLCLLGLFALQIKLLQDLDSSFNRPPHYRLVNVTHGAEALNVRNQRNFIIASVCNFLNSFSPERRRAAHLQACHNLVDPLGCVVKFLGQLLVNRVGTNRRALASGRNGLHRRCLREKVGKA